MWRMRGHRQHKIVMIGIHLFNFSTQRLPKVIELCHRTQIRASLRHQQAPAIVKQAGKTRFRARMLGAGKGMGRHKMNRVGQAWCHCIYHRPFYRSDIADRRTGF